MNSDAVNINAAAKILIVDDQEANVELLEMMLDLAGYTDVTGITDSRLALDFYKKNRFDLVLLDLRMPHIDGYELLTQLSEVIENDYLPVLVLTAETEHKSRLKAVQLGAKDFVTKPFDKEEVLNRISNILEVRMLHNKVKDQNAHLEQLVQLRTAELTASETRFMDFAGSASDWFWETDADLRFSYLSENYFASSGVSPDAVLGKTRKELLGENYNRSSWDEHLAAIESHQPFRDFEYLLSSKTKKAEKIWVRTSGVPIFDEGGIFSGYRGSASNISVQREEERRARIAEQRFRALFDNSPDALLLKDTNGQYLIANSRWHEWFNPESVCIEGKTAFDFYPKEHADKVAAQDKKIVDTAKTISQEYLTPLADGTRIPTILQKFPVLDRDNNVVAIGGVNTDVTEAKWAKKQLSVQEYRLQTALDNMSGGMFMVDLGLNIQVMTTGVGALFDCPEGLMAPGKSVIDIIKFRARRGDYGKGDIDKLIAERIESFRAREPVILEDVTQDGLTLELSLSPLADGGVVGVLNDITERKRSQDDLLFAMDQVVKATQVKSDFMANMSHELRTPLNAILGFSDMMANQYLGPLGNDQYVDYATNISTSGQHLLALVNDILDIEQIVSGNIQLEYTEIDVSNLVDESLISVRQKASEEGISLKVSIADNLGPFLADRHTILQVLINLVSNAVKFTSAGGEVIIEADVDGASNIFVVRDTGIGISEDKIPTLTEPFSRHNPDPHKAQDGVGLGLSISNSLVKQHGGELTIHSEVGVGTIVNVTIPNMVQGL